MKNFFIRLFVALCRPFIKTNQGERFLIVSTTGLGDTLWGTPAIRALRESYPNGYIALLTSPLGKQVLQNNPHIDELFEIKDFFVLKRRKIATVLVFHTSQRIVLPLCNLLGASRIIGTEKINKGLDALLTDRLESNQIHEIERRLNIVAQVGCKISSRKMELPPERLGIYHTEENRAVFSVQPHFLPSLCPAKASPLIGLHPGAKDRFKQWAPSHFIELGQRLQKELQCRIVVTGTSAEKHLVTTIATAIDGAVPIYEGISISDLASLIKRLSLFITNDTGPLHMACATKTPTIALFTPTDPLLCGPYFAPHVKVIQKKPTCFPCIRKKCHDPFCMLQIAPDEVYKTALQLLCSQ